MEIADQYAQYLHSLFNKAYPRVQQDTWEHELKHWFSQSTTELIHKKRLLFALISAILCQHFMTVIGSLAILCVSIVGMTLSSILFLFPLISNTHKRFWHWSNAVKKFRSPTLSLSHANCDIANDAEKASAFNQNFCSVFTKEIMSNLHQLGPDISPAAIFNSVTIIHLILF